MAAISGLNGNVVYASGYTTIVDGWNMNIEAALQDLTPFRPTSNHVVQMTSNLLKGATGGYNCKLGVDHLATLASAGYAGDPDEWTFVQTCEAREITPFTAQWRTFIPGLLDSEAEVIHYVDDGETVPLAGDSGTAVLTVTTGKTVSMPFICQSRSPGVTVADDQRRITAFLKASGFPTIVGLPAAGTTGTGEFYISANRALTATILVTRVQINVNRRESRGSIGIQYVANGEVTRINPA
jgi:hypothetical protein